MAEKETNRWIIVLGALLIQVCLGAVYIWSVFKAPLIKEFGWDAASVSFTFSLTILVFSITTIFAGKLQDAIGPRWVATGGGVLYALGLILASKTTSLGYLYATFAVVGGIGIGAGYVCPLACCVKWFPDKKGLITGLAVAGFGLGGDGIYPGCQLFSRVFRLTAGFCLFRDYLWGCCSTWSTAAEKPARWV